MFPYWILFIIPAWMALSYLGRPPLPVADAGESTQVLPWAPWLVAGLGLALVIGYRFQVGGDWGSYLQLQQGMSELSWQQSLVATEPAYGLLNWLGAHGGGGIYLVNLVCGLIFSGGLVAFCRIQPRPWLALTVAVPYLVIVVAMGYSRQSVAIGLAMYGFVALHRERIRQFLCWILLAVLFHKSAVILIPMLLFAGRRNRSIKWLSLPVVLLVVYALLLQNTADKYDSGYVTAGFSSSGAVIRVAMNALPASMFILFNRRFQMPREQNTFWLWMAWGALALVVLLVVSPSSTAVDRVALYWIPIQLVVWSRLPDAMSPQGRDSLPWGSMVIVYNAVVQFTWLFYAVNAYSWLPYQFYPWVALWQ